MRRFQEITQRSRVLLTCSRANDFSGRHRFTPRRPCLHPLRPRQVSSAESTASKVLRYRAKRSEKHSERSNLRDSGQR